jgi:hypothetical protein
MKGQLYTRKIRSYGAFLFMSPATLEDSSNSSQGHHNVHEHLSGAESFSSEPMSQSRVPMSHTRVQQPAKTGVPQQSGPVNTSSSRTHPPAARPRAPVPRSCEDDNESNTVAQPPLSSHGLAPHPSSSTSRPNHQPVTQPSGTFCVSVSICARK